MGSFIFRLDCSGGYPASGHASTSRCTGSRSTDLSGLRQGKVLRDDADLGANGVLILGKALEHEDAAVDVDADMVALPVLFVDLFAREAEMAALIDVAEHAEAELDWMNDFGVEGTESIFGSLQGDSACHLVSYALLVGGRAKVGLGLKVEAEATIGFAIGRQDEVAGKYLQKLSRAILVVFVSLILPAELVGVGHKVVDAALLGFGFGCGQGPVVDRNQAAEGAVGCLDDVFSPEVSAGTGRALLGDVEVVRSPLSSSDFIRGHLLDEAGSLRPCGGGEKSEGDGGAYPLGAQTSTTVYRDREG